MSSSSISTAAEELIHRHIERLLSIREFPKTICPSEAPRALSNNELEVAGVSDWRVLMPEARKVLWGMRDHGEVEILQGGVPLPDSITVEEVKGPIRARRKRL